MACNTSKIDHELDDVVLYHCAQQDDEFREVLYALSGYHSATLMCAN